VGGLVALALAGVFAVTRISIRRPTPAAAADTAAAAPPPEASAEPAKPTDEPEGPAGPAARPRLKPRVNTARPHRPPLTRHRDPGGQARSYAVALEIRNPSE